MNLQALGIAGDGGCRSNLRVADMVAVGPGAIVGGLPNLLALLRGRGGVRCGDDRRDRHLASNNSCQSIGSRVRSSGGG